MALAEAVDNPPPPSAGRTKEEGRRMNGGRRPESLRLLSGFIPPPSSLILPHQEDCLSLWLACPERGGRCATRTPRSPRPSRRHLAGWTKDERRMDRPRPTVPPPA